MASKCEVCGKGPSWGMSVSHSHRRTKRRWNPNIQRVRAVVDGVPKRIKICTRCMKAGKLVKPATQKRIEERLTKDQILFLYLNQINFGRGVYGIELAARHWFGKSATHLTLAEAASLASMPKSPVQYDPATQELVVYESLTVTVTFEDPSAATAQESLYSVQAVQVVALRAVLPPMRDPPTGSVDPDRGSLHGGQTDGAAAWQ